MDLSTKGTYMLCEHSDVLRVHVDVCCTRLRLVFPVLSTGRSCVADKDVCFDP